MCVRCAVQRKRTVIASLWVSFLAVLVWSAIEMARNDPEAFREALPAGTIVYIVLALCTINLAAWLFEPPAHPPCS